MKLFDVVFDDVRCIMTERTAHLGDILLRYCGVDLVPHDTGHFFARVKKLSAIAERLICSTRHGLHQVSEGLDERSSSFIIVVIQCTLYVK